MKVKEVVGNKAFLMKSVWIEEIDRAWIGGLWQRSLYKLVVLKCTVVLRIVVVSVSGVARYDDETDNGGKRLERK